MQRRIISINNLLPQIGRVMHLVVFLKPFFNLNVNWKQSINLVYLQTIPRILLFLSEPDWIRYWKNSTYFPYLFFRSLSMDTSNCSTVNPLSVPSSKASNRRSGSATKVLSFHHSFVSLISFSRRL